MAHGIIPRIVGAQGFLVGALMDGWAGYGFSIVSDIREIDVRLRTAWHVQKGLGLSIFEDVACLGFGKVISNAYGIFS